MRSKKLRAIEAFVLAMMLLAICWGVSGGILTSGIAFTLGQAFVGPVGSNDAFTRLVITNRETNPCEVQISMSRGSNPAPPIRINGELVQDNATNSTIPPGGVRVFDFSSTVLVQGIIAIALQSPCTRDWLRIAGTYFVTNESGQLLEAFTIPVNMVADWLTKDRCAALSYNFDPTGTNGIRSNLGLVTSSVVPLAEPPSEAQLRAWLFDAEGSPLGEEVIFEVNGIHSPFFPLDQFPGLLPQQVTLVLCLETSEPEKNFQLDLTAIGVRGSPADTQFEAPIFADAFEAGDTTVWSR